MRAKEANKTTKANNPKETKEKPYLFKVNIIELSNSSLFSTLNPSLSPLNQSRSMVEVGVDFGYEMVSIEELDVSCKLQLWFVSTKKEFKSLYSVYFRGSLGAIMLIDSADEGTFAKVEEMVGYLRDTLPTRQKDNPVLLAFDTGICERISPEPRSRLKSFAKRLEFKGMCEISIGSKRNVGELFKMMAKLILNPEFMYTSYYF
jgi:hypothetical protein